MKIAYVATSDGGGAGHAALRLHEGMLRRGISSDLLLRERFSNAARLEVIKTRADLNEYLAFARDASISQYVHRNRNGPSNSHFTINVDGIDLSDHRIMRASDVVHLHWISGFQTPKDVEALLRKKPVVWTLHDAEPLTGGCHYPSGCDGYTNACYHCPQLANDPWHLTEGALAEKIARWSRHPFTLVVPSNYMAEHVRRSVVGALENVGVVHIPHGVDVQTFRPRPKIAARRLLGVPVDGTYIVAGSLITKEHRKGLHRVGDISTAIRRRLPQSLNLRLLVVGAPKLDDQSFPGLEVIQLGRLPVEKMPHVFAASDLFLHTSYEDNSPLMLLEALACGIPAIAFSSGGASELIEESSSGHVIELGDESAMVEAASAALANAKVLQAMGVNARQRVEERFSDDLSIDRHLALYEAVCSRPRPSALPPLRISALDSRITSCFNSSMVTQMSELRDRVDELEMLVEVQSREVMRKQEEVQAVHGIATRREELIQTLHAEHATYAASSAKIIEHQRREIEVLRGIAAERLRLITVIEEAASERKQLLQELHDERLRQVQSSETIMEQQRTEILLAHGIAAERLRVIQRFEELASNWRQELEDLHAKRTREILASHATAEEQKREIALVHGVAAERLRAIEDLHHELERMQGVIGDLNAMLEERRSEAFEDHRFELAPLGKSNSPGACD